MSENQTDQRSIRLASIVSINAAALSANDQQGAARQVKALRARVEAVAATHGGRFCNAASDGLLLEFASAGAALGAIQDLLDNCPRREPPIRIGAHVGDVIVTAAEDLLGHGVDVAARLQEMAEPGAALVSAEFRSMAHSSPTAAFQAKGRGPLENIEQRVQTFEILSRRLQAALRLRRRLWALGLAAAAAALVFLGPSVWRALAPLVK